jgi:glycosyltransferase
MKKELYRDNGLFDLTFRIAADYDQMIRILQRSYVKVNTEAKK